MYSYLNELTLYAGVLYMQPSWYSFSSWLDSDITSLGRSVTCTLLTLPFLKAEMFLYQFFLRVYTCVGFSATQNTCDRYNKFAIDHLKIILCTIGNL